MTIGHRKVEVDALFIYKNIWLLCEDTVKTSNIREHIRIKNEAFGEIKNNLDEFRAKLTDLFPDKDEIIKEFNDSRILVFGLYISKNEIPLLANDPELFEHLIFVQPQTLDYFQWIVKCIKLSARNEISANKKQSA